MAQDQPDTIKSAAWSLVVALVMTAMAAGVECYVFGIQLTVVGITL